MKTSAVFGPRFSYACAVNGEGRCASCEIAERIAGGAHTKMEFDPAVWEEVEKLILEEIRQP